MNILLLSILLAGCTVTSSGYNFRIADANKICDGQTLDEVIHIMGSKPTSVNGGKYVWAYTRTTFTGWQIKKAAITFDENGKVTGLPDCGLFRNVDTAGME